jgi:hypothetical protein
MCCVNVWGDTQRAQVLLRLVRSRHAALSPRGAEGGRTKVEKRAAGMQRSVHVALKAAARKSKNERTFVCDGTVLGRADPGYVHKFFSSWPYILVIVSS